MQFKKPHQRTALQDGYAVRFSEGAGDFPVAFEALAGMPPGKLDAGQIAYITTGEPCHTACLLSRPTMVDLQTNFAKMGGA